MGSQAHFTPGLFQFLKDLKSHNNRDWFEKNRPRYEADVKGPLLRFIAHLDAQLRRISPHVTADPRPVGGSMFRIHRDIRFSRDKSPYKTNVGAHFHHLRAGRGAPTPRGSPPPSTRRAFLERYVAVCRRTTPLMEFLTKALGMPW